MNGKSTDVQILDRKLIYALNSNNTVGVHSNDVNCVYFWWCATRIRKIFPKRRKDKAKNIRLECNRKKKAKKKGIGDRYCETIYSEGFSIGIVQLFPKFQ